MRIISICDSTIPAFPGAYLQQSPASSVAKTHTGYVPAQKKRLHSPPSSDKI
jgi:hypothetical protein